MEMRRGHAGTRTWESEPGEIHHQGTGEPGGLWRHRGRAPQTLVGTGFSAQGYDRGRPYRRLPASRDPRAAFAFEGVSEDEPIGDFGLVLGAAGGWEFDRADPALGTPAHALVLAAATGFSDGYQTTVEEVRVADSRQGGTVSPLVRGDMVYFETGDGGAVFSTSSISWCGSLSHVGYDNDVSRITENVLRRFTGA
jgi:N,N-dimethylformamidase